MNPTTLITLDLLSESTNLGGDRLLLNEDLTRLHKKRKKERR